MYERRSNQIVMQPKEYIMKKLPSQYNARDAINAKIMFPQVNFDGPQLHVMKFIKNHI